MPKLMFLLAIGLASGCIAFFGAYAAFWLVLAPSADEVDGVTVIVASGLSMVIATVSAIVIVLFLRNRV